MKLSELINSLKEFFLDFLGYFAPGFFLLILLEFVLVDSLKAPMSSFFKGDSVYVIFAFISYILGYMIYSMSESFISKYLFLINKIGKINKPFFKRFDVKDRNVLSLSLNRDKNFELCKSKLKNIWLSEGLPNDKIEKRLNDISGRELRNIVMYI